MFLTLEDELTDLHSTEINLDWATKRIKQGLLDWVSSAIVIKKVFRFRLYKDQFSDCKDYCIRALGKKAEWIKMLIDRAEVVIELAKAGFTILPTNQSQVSQLIRCCKRVSEKMRGDLGNQLSPYFPYRQAVRPRADVRRKGTRTKTGMPCLFPISLYPYLPR